MGGVADAVGSFVSDAVGGISDAVSGIGDVIQSVGNIADSAIQEVGHAAESVGREVEKVGQAAANDPIGTIAKVAAVATGQVWALPIIAAVDVIAHGGNIEQAALSAGISYVGGYVAAGVGDYLGAGSTASVDLMSQDAVDLANQGLSQSQIADVLQQSYNVSSDIATQTATQAATGAAASDIASNITSQMTTQNMLAGVAGNTAGGMTRTALSGGDINQILMSGVTTGAGSLAGSLTTAELKDLGANNTVANALGKATGAATASTVAGKDAKVSFINSLINTTLNESGKQVNSALKSAWNDVNSNATKYNDQLKTAQDTFDKTVTPLQAEVKDLQTTAKASYDEYKPISDKYNELLSQFNDAKAAGNVDLANSLVGQLNAMAPDLNAAANKYNTDVAAFQDKNTQYTGAVDQYKTQVATADQIKSEYDQSNTALTKTADELKTAATAVADMPETAKKTFAALYDSGANATEALDTTKTVNAMSTTAQGAFLRNLVTTQDPTQALEIAKTVNNMSTTEQSSYLNAVRYGMDDTTAIATAPNISNLSNTSQQVYLDSIKNGADPYAASVTATLAELFGAATPSNAPAYAPTAQTNTTGSVTDVGGGSDPLVKVNGIQTQSIGGTTFAYNDKTGKYDIPVADVTLDGSSNAASLQSTDTTGTGGATNVVQVGTQVNPDGTVTEKYSDGSTKIFDPETGQYLSTGLDMPSWLNNPAIADSTVGSGPATSTGGAPIGTTTATNTTGGASSTPGTSTVVGSPTPGTGGTGGTATTPGGGPVIGGTGTGGDGTGTGTGTGGSGSGSGTGSNGTSTGTSGTGTSKTGTSTLTYKTSGGGGGYSYTPSSQDMYGGIRNLAPGLTDKLDYTLAGLPNIQETMNPIPQFATGSSVDTTSSSNTYDPFNTGTGNSSGISSSLTPGFTKAKLDYLLAGMPGANIVSHAQGGAIEGHNPTFFSEGGLSSMENRYVEGEGDGTSDSVAAMLANGEFVIPADVVSKLGNGSNEAGASVLDQFLKVVRTDANSNGDKLPPKSKGPLAYLLDAKRNMKA